MSCQPDDLKIEYVADEIIRQIFNDLGFFTQIKSGQMIQHLKRSSHPNPPPRGEPKCTFSQIAYYYTPEGDLRAVVHQYLRPDGTLGASGLPDPKRIFLEDKIISVVTKPPE